MPRIQIKRVYEAPTETDGVRILVDRVWPRGISKAKLKADLWLNDVAPSTTLRKWFGHDPAKWPQFKRRYFAELKKNRDALKPLRDAKGAVTLLYSAHDEQHNQAVALREYLMRSRSSK
jgi:uncharacterized protein YeaO (DUF488 family)